MSKILKVGLSSMVSLDYLYNPEFLKPYVDENYFNDKKLGFQVIEKGIVLPFKPHPNYSGTNALGGIIDSNGTFIKGSHIYDYKIGRGYTPPPPNQSNIALKQPFILDISFMFGDIVLPITFVGFGF